MKGFLLAAGLGTRLKPITDSIPKCLVPVCGKPLLGWWIDLFEQHGITEIAINLHHFPEQVTAFLDTQQHRVKFEYLHEPVLLGSGGTVKHNRDFVKNEKDFFIFYADNLTNYNLSSMLNFHREKGKEFTMALFRTPTPKACGIATLDENKTIVQFTEKPEHPVSDLANAGIYITQPHILELIPDYELTDIGFHLLPLLQGRMAGWETQDYLLDIGTHQSLAKAESDWLKFIKQ